jgi:hypothetical protein
MIRCLYEKVKFADYETVFCRMCANLKSITIVGRGQVPTVFLLETYLDKTKKGRIKRKNALGFVQSSFLPSIPLESS